MLRFFWPATLAFLLLASSCLPIAGTEASEARHGIAVADMDLSVDPREDFYRFANGGWLDRTEIPADKSSYGTFTELYDLTTEQLLEILRSTTSVEDALPSDSDEGKAVAMWEQGMDTATRNRLGLTPIEPILADIEAIGDLDDYHAFLRAAPFVGIRGSLPIGVSPDLKESGINAVYLGGPWLGLPNRDYYLDEGNEEIRDAYIATSAEFMTRLGTADPDALKAARAVYDFEARLAATTLTREERQNPETSYNPATIAEVGERYPAMDWTAYLEQLGIPETRRMIVTQVEYLEELDAILSDTAIETLRDYLRLQLLWGYNNNLDLDLERTAFAFAQALGGQAEMAPLDERVLGQVNGLMGDALGKLYVEEHFPPVAKEEIEKLTDQVIASFRMRLQENTWMTPETRERAVAKLDALRVKVGYPDEWETYEGVEIGANYFESVASAANAALRKSLSEAGKPVDRDEWGMNAQTVNAYYSPVNNEIVFPAAILQPPFFDYRADAASNLGAIGFVIGHEITHGFDLAGSKFDENGNLDDWWTTADRERFEALNDRLVAQYDAIEVLPDVFVNGQITVTENVADLGGIATAHDALMKTLALDTSATPRATPSDATDADFTPQQRFFIAAATVWRAKIRDEALRTRIKSGVHAPPEVRAVQPLRNTDAFFAAFAVGPGDPMFLSPEKRVVIW